MGCFQEEIRVFILYEHNEEVGMDIFKMEDPFWNVFFLIYVHDTVILWLWKEGREEVNKLYVCSWNLWSAYYTNTEKKCSLKQHYENFVTSSIAHGYEKLGNFKIYIQVFT